MPKCANCDKDAVFAYTISDTYKIYYCATDLPKFLRGKTASSLLKSVVVPSEPTSKKKKAKETTPEVTSEPTE